MTIATGKDLGNLRVAFEDMLGNAVLTSDAVQVSGGMGEFLCPTDLVATALGGCVMMTLSIAGKGHNIDVSGMRMEIDKVMGDDAPRRIAKIHVRIFFATCPTLDEQDTLRRAAATCPVKNSLHPDMIKEVELIFAEK